MRRTAGKLQKKKTALPVPKLPARQGGQPLNLALLNPVVQLHQLLSPLHVVEALYAEWHTDGLTVWLVVNGAGEADRERIYEKEWSLMQAFPGLGLDVYLLDRQETDPETITNLEHMDVFLRFAHAAYA
jgi:hypothetical protein